MVGTIASWTPLDTTAFAPGYSEAGFKSIPIGASAAEVITALGQPLSTLFAYGSGLEVSFDAAGIVTSVYPTSRRSEVRGATREDVLRELGDPDREVWTYSWSPSGSHYRNRGLELVGRRLTRKGHEFYWD